MIIMNTISLDLIKEKTEREVIDSCKSFPYKTLWLFKDAFEYAELVLCHYQGNKYLQTGNINSFRKII